MTKYLFTAFIFCVFFIPQQVDAAAFYVDFNCDLNADTACGNGTATTTPFDNLDKFSEVARSAGDIAFVRRGQASTTNLSQLTFTSDGTLLAPIVISADFDNLWNDFATSSQTWTVAAATSTFVGSASTTGIVAGDWVYIMGDCSETYNSVVVNRCEFSYEVKDVVNNLITLYRPYDGNQSGSGLELRKMASNPVWGTTASSCLGCWVFAGDQYWFLKGLDFRDSDPASNCSIGINAVTVSPIEFDDFVFLSNDNTTCLFGTSASVPHSVIVKRARLNDWGTGVVNMTTGLDAKYTFDKSVFINATLTLNYGTFFLSNSIFDTDDILAGAQSTSGNTGDVFIRNLTFLNTSNIDYNLQNGTSWSDSNIYDEDDDGILGFNKFYSPLNSANDVVTTMSTTSPSFLRAGGGPVSIEVTPGASLNTVWSYGAQKLFEYPIYTDGSSKQYDVYFMSPSDTWTTNPTNSQIWIECEYWAHDTNATSTRKTKKSTGTVDFNGSTAWQALSVTCDPSQTGLLYLRGWYAKTKEAGTNLFYVDGTPVII